MSNHRHAQHHERTTLLDFAPLPVLRLLYTRLPHCRHPLISLFDFTCFRQTRARIVAIGIMSEPDQCIICLDHLPTPASINGASSDDSVTAAFEHEAAEPQDSYLNVVAALDGCEHIIHDACIRSWAKKTNTCPICRTPFHSVRVYNGVDGMTDTSPLNTMNLFSLKNPTIC